MEINDLIKEIENLKKTKGRINTVEIANMLGIKVFTTKDIQQSSFIAFDPKTQSYSIYINSREGGTRQRFSIAHEIAHYLLHKDKIITFGVVGRQCNSSLTPNEEKCADALAGELLMPAACVKEYMAKYNVSMDDKLDLKIVKDFSKEFEVSLIAGALRLRELGYYVGYIEL